MNLELIKQILIIGIGASIFSTAVIQKIKEQLKNKKWLFYISLVVSVGIGISFSLSFTELNIINSIWVGITTWVGADLLYNAFEDKIFKRFSDITNVTKIERDDENEL